MEKELEFNEVVMSGLNSMIKNTHQLNAEQTTMTFIDNGYRLTIQLDKIQGDDYDE